MTKILGGVTWLASFLEGFHATKRGPSLASLPRTSSVHWAGASFRGEKDARREAEPLSSQIVITRVQALLRKRCPCSRPHHRSGRTRGSRRPHPCRTCDCQSFAERSVQR